MPIQGLTWKTLKGHPPLIALFVIVGGGAVGAAYYIGRLCVRSPDVRWANKSDGMTANASWPEGKRYKFMSTGIDYQNLKHHPERPAIETMKAE